MEPRRLAAVLSLALTLSGASARAQQVDPDEALYLQAQQARSADPEGALRIYRELRDRTRSPRALAQVGLLEGQLGRWVSAEESLAAALAAEGDAWVTPRRAALETNLQAVRAHLSDLTVSVDAPGARLRVDEVDVGALPLARPARVARGTHVVDVDADGYEHARQTVEATAATTQVAVTLVRRLAAPAPPPPPQVITRIVREVVPARAPEPAPSSWPLRRGLGIGAVAFGAVGLGVGVVALAARNGYVSTFTDRYCYLDGETPQGPVGQGCDAVYADGSTMGALSIAGFAAGGALVVGGLLLLVVRPAASPGSARASLQCAIDLGSVRCGGTF